MPEFPIESSISSTERACALPQVQLNVKPAKAMRLIHDGCVFYRLAAFIAFVLAPAVAWCDPPTLVTGIVRADDSGVSHVSTELIRRHIETLSSPEMEGRGTFRGKQLARKYIVDQFRLLKLEPLFGGLFVQDVPGPNTETGQRTIAGRNLGGIVRGSDPKLRDELILIGAHYDHLGIKNGKLYPGANDNASSVAMLLETARLFSNSRVRPRRSIAFVGFDLEESLLWGSRWFAAHPPVPQEQIKLFITAEMLGRTLGDLPLPLVFVMGSEHGKGLRELIDGITPPRGVEAAHLGVDLIGERSDYVPFQSAEIPFLFFTGGEYPDYHQPGDTADRIDFDRVAKITQWIHGVTQRAADQSEPAAWTNSPRRGMDEIVVLHRISTAVIERDAQAKSPADKLSFVQMALVSNVHLRTKQILERGTLDPAERPWLIRSSQLLLLSVF